MTIYLVIIEKAWNNGNIIYSAHQDEHIAQHVANQLNAEYSEFKAPTMQEYLDAVVTMTYVEYVQMMLNNWEQTDNQCTALVQSIHVTNNEV